MVVVADGMAAGFECCNLEMHSVADRFQEGLNGRGTRCIDARAVSVCDDRNLVRSDEGSSALKTDSRHTTVEAHVAPGGLAWGLTSHVTILRKADLTRQILRQFAKPSARSCFGSINTEVLRSSSS